MKKRFLILSLVGLFGLICISKDQFNIGNIAALFHHSLIFICVATWCLSLARYPLGDILQAHLTAVKDKTIPKELSAYYAELLEEMRRTYLNCGLFALFFGSLQVLILMDDPSAIGPAMALSILGMFYALMISEVITRPLCHIHSKNLIKYNHSHEAKVQEEEPLESSKPAKFDQKKMEGKAIPRTTEDKEEEYGILLQNSKFNGQRNRVRFIFLGLVILGLGGAFSDGSINLSYISILINPRYLIAFLGISWLFTLAYHSPVEMIHAHLAPTQSIDPSPSTVEDDQRHILTLTNLYNLSITTGLLLFFVGYVQLLMDMGDHNKLGKMFGECLIPLMYSFVYAEFLCTPLINKLKLRSVLIQKQSVVRDRVASQLNLTLVFTTVSLITIVFFIVA